MRVRFRRPVLLLFGVALILVATGCSSIASNGSASGGSSPTAKGDYVVGVDDLLSGPVASYGNYTLTYIRAAADYVNSIGGINGHQVRVVTADMAATGQNASSAAQQLIASSKVNALAGFTLSAYCGQVAPMAGASRVPMICYSIPGSVVKPVEPYVFGGYPVNNQGGRPSITFATHYLKLPAGTTFATYGTDAAGNVAYVTTVTKQAIGAGFKQVSHQVVPITAVNGNTQIAQLVASKPQLVFAYPNEPQLLPLVKSLRAAGNDAPIIMPPGAASYTDIIAAADPNLYALSVTRYITNLHPTESGAALLVKAMKLENQTSLAQINQLLGNVAFPQAYALMLGLKACGYPCSGPGLQTALDKTNFTLPGVVNGSFTWTADSHVPYSFTYIYRYDQTTKQPVSLAILPLGGVDD